MPAILQIFKQQRSSSALRPSRVPYPFSKLARGTSCVATLAAVLPQRVLKRGMAHGSSKLTPGFFIFRNIARGGIGLHALSDR